MKTEEYLNEVKKIHKSKKYDISKIKNIDSSTTVDVICNKHKIEFKLPKKQLLKKQEICPLCVKEKQAENKIERMQYLFENWSSYIHNNKYDYSKVNYKSSTINVKIICPIHGVFEQIPSVHVLGHGCPKCNQKGTNVRVKFYIDLFINEYLSFFGNSMSILNNNRNLTSYEKFVESLKITTVEKRNLSNKISNVLTKNIFNISMSTNGMPLLTEELGVQLETIMYEFISPKIISKEKRLLLLEIHSGFVNKSFNKDKSIRNLWDSKFNLQKNKDFEAYKRILKESYELIDKKKKRTQIRAKSNYMPLVTQVEYNTPTKAYSAFKNVVVKIQSFVLGMFMNKCA